MKLNSFAAPTSFSNEWVPLSRPGLINCTHWIVKSVTETCTGNQCGL
jgi:hypothetical protein